MLGLRSCAARARRLTRTAARADVGAWARVRAGLYKGDLAKVVDVDHSAGRALVRLVPRLDYAALAQRREEGRQPGLPFGQMPAVRPPARCARGARSDCCGPGRLAGAAGWLGARPAPCARPRGQARQVFLPVTRRPPATGMWLGAAEASAPSGHHPERRQALATPLKHRVGYMLGQSRIGAYPMTRSGARAFAEGEAKEHRLLVEKKRGQDGSGFYFVLNGSQRFEDGYLLKQVALKSLMLEEALPPLDELQRFNQARCAPVQAWSMPCDGVGR